MKRTQYQTGIDLANEQQVMETCQKLWRWPDKYHKLPISYQLDYACIHNGSVTAFVEIKCRKHSFERFPDLFISLNKFKAGVEYYNMGIDFILIVKFDQEIYAYKYDPSHKIKISFGGRNNARDFADREPLAHIPTELFKPAKTPANPVSAVKTYQEELKVKLELYKYID